MNPLFTSNIELENQEAKVNDNDEEREIEEGNFK